MKSVVWMMVLLTAINIGVFALNISTQSDSR
jgi:hypothetical protein